MRALLKSQSIYYPCGHRGYVRFAQAFTLFISLAAVGIASCSDEGGPKLGDSADFGANPPDASVFGDAGVDRKVTYIGDVQPILRARCADCHGAGVVMPSSYPLFAESYAETQLPSKRCPGDSVGKCVGLAVENQAVEGTGCRTFVVRPFHRESWICLTQPEQAQIAAWMAGGLLER